MFWAYFDPADGNGLASATLNGLSPAQTFELATGTPTDATATGVAVWYLPSTGSQTLDVAWDSTPTEGPTCIVAYVKGGNTTAWRDADADHDETTNAVTVTLTTVAGDLVIKFDQRFHDSTPPSTSAGWTSAQTHDGDAEVSRLSYISAAGATQGCDSEDENYSSIVAISIPAAAGGGGQWGRDQGYFYSRPGRV
jgi:hypothetical protein